MKSAADEDSSSVFSVGALIVKEEMGKDNKQDDEANDQRAELRSVAAPENSKTPPEATVEDPNVIDQNEHVELDVAALENSATAGRPRCKAAAKAMPRKLAVAAFEKSKVGECSRAAPGGIYQVPEVTEQNEHVKLDFAALENDDRIVKMAESMNKRLASRLEVGQCSCPRSTLIYQVPKLLREVDEDSYEPKLISIGPYHRTKGHLQPMEEQKLEHLERILSRNKKVKLKEYMRAIGELEQQARKCYASQSITEISQEDFVGMMLLDGCFLLEIFLQNSHAVGKKSEDVGHVVPKIYQHNWLRDFISRDMLLLENQLPYFVLNCIFILVWPREKSRPNLADLILVSFRFVRPMPLNEALPPLKGTYRHLLDLFHHHCLPRHSSRDNFVGRIKDDVTSCFSINLPNMRACTTQACSESDQSQDQQGELQIQAMFESQHSITRKRRALDQCLQTFGNWLTCPSSQLPMAMHSAEELQEAGIVFEQPKPQPESFLSIKFQKSRGAIQIPHLHFYKGLHSVLQNLVAFEQYSCSDANEFFFVGYVLFMDRLISSGKDVNILRRSQVLDNGLDSDERLAHVFNQMGRGVFADSGVIPLSSLHGDINRYCKLRRACYSRWRGYCARNYCKTPCATIALLAAAVIFFLTTVQTYFNVFPRS